MPSPIRAEPGAAHSHTPHTVQFYESDEYLARTVCGFLADGLTAGHPIVIIATPEHRELFAAQLAAMGRPIPKLGNSGGAHVLDAHATLAAIMGDDGDELPDADRFETVIGGVLRQAAGSNGSAVRACGEMVDVLWECGRIEAALRLEHLWNEIAPRYNLSLFCAYAMKHFQTAADGIGFELICHEHTRVVPTESYGGLFDQTSREREVGRLQQRAFALQAEVAHRRELESELRQALTDRQGADVERETLLAASQAARAEAEHANRLKDEFLAVLSHELRTPLNAIVGWASIASSDLLADETTIRRALKVIQRNAAMQLRLIDDLLDLSRAMTGKMLLNVGPVDLVAIANATIDTVRPSAAARNLKLEAHLPPQAVHVLGESARLQQVIWNLVSNAVKFTPDGGLVELRVECAGEDGRARLSVRDTGEGIAPEFLPHVFERFRQADSSSTRRHGGLGLGLSLTKYLVEAHGGSVAAHSDGPGRGAVFTITLPSA